MNPALYKWILLNYYRKRPASGNSKRLGEGLGTLMVDPIPKRRIKKA